MAFKVSKHHSDVKTSNTASVGEVSRLLSKQYGTGHIVLTSKDASMMTTLAGQATTAAPFNTIKTAIQAGEAVYIDTEDLVL